MSVDYSSDRFSMKFALNRSETQDFTSNVHGREALVPFNELVSSNTKNLDKIVEEAPEKEIGTAPALEVGS